MNTDSMFNEWLRRQLGLPGGTLPSSFPTATSTPLATASVASDPVSTGGLLYYAVQVSGISGSDVFAIETSNDGVTWTAAPSPVVGNANGTYQFTGIYNFVRARKVSGSGVTTLITLMGRS